MVKVVRVEVVHYLLTGKVQGPGRGNVEPWSQRLVAPSSRSPTTKTEVSGQMDLEQLTAGNEAVEETSSGAAGVEASTDFAEEQRALRIRGYFKRIVSREKCRRQMLISP